MEFESWKALEEYNASVADPIYCKAQLSRMGRKPLNERDYAEHDVKNNHYRTVWNSFKFYKLSNTVEKRKAVRVIREIPQTPESLCEALYVINKSAKLSRDTAGSSYNRGKHGQARTAKQRKNMLYALKDAAVEKMATERLLTLEGYSIQTLEVVKTERKLRCDSCREGVCVKEFGEWCDVMWSKPIKKKVTDTNYLLLYRYGDFSFHVPRKDEPENLVCLGTIDELISAEKTRKCAIKFGEAVALLEKYVEGGDVK